MRTADRQTRRVLFIHPSFPSQFTAIGAELAAMPGMECYGLTYQANGPQIAAASPGMPHFGFLPDGALTPYSYGPSGPFEIGMRNARGIAATLLGIRERYIFDAVVAHAMFGAMLGLRSLLDCALVAYVELPGYHAAAARPEFPLTLDGALSSYACESLAYISMLHADLGIVPSEYSRQLFPPELRPKICVQMEGFDVAHLPPGGQAERHALGLPVDAPLVGFFGRTLEAVRGFDIFVQVAARLHASDPALQFLVIGDAQTLYGNEMTYLSGRSFKSYALEQAGVPEQLFHWRPAMPYELFRRHIACLDLAILPVFAGAANWSLFEAMAAGLPIISSRCCYVPEAIRDGQEGVLLDAYDIDGFVRTAQQLLSDSVRARALGAAARARIQNTYTLGHAANGYRRIIEEAIMLHALRSGGAAAAPAPASMARLPV